MTERPEYQAKPLVEAVFELFADPDVLTQWSNASVTKIADRFRPYGSYEEHLQDVGIHLHMGDDGVVKSKPHAPQERIRRWDAPRQKAIQFGAHMCAYNVLGAAYTHFDEHLESIADVIRFYLEESKPQKLAWVGQRYINAIKVPLAEDDVAPFFSIYPQLPPSLRGHRPVSIQVQTAAVKGGQVFANLSLQQKDDTVANYTLDIYARSGNDVPPDIDELMSWHADMHGLVHEAFELSISERSRLELFKRIR